MSSFSDRDLGAKATIARLRRTKTSITVGVHAAEGAAAHGTNGATVGDVAVFREIGTSRTPAAPYLAPWFDRNASQNAARLLEAGRAIIAGAEPTTALERVGEEMAAEVRATMKPGQVRDAVTSRVGGT